ncbi:hypothetical protein [Mesohalobacter halotolerans]|uniref:Uncharacterized protein n=1 Tax=Mesohalobacter halotolerans TaxID=1883405 RepID=A0A4U5TQX3_9FLAO|nr:hypothetical protein [Mesohalobacter halotolerans]MBS3738823.1 hypothetical protein [Psychroflexus sp.]TKS56463.1 hypothetical protein FCN74_05310 [Mesohalobacter halotolerans]
MKAIIKPIIRLAIYAVLFYLCTIPIEADFLIGQANESNAIELAQQSILLITIILGFISLAYTAQYKTFMAVMSLFIGLHLIRELDAWFDTHIFNIGWFPYVVVLAIVMFYILIKNLKSFSNQIKSLSHTAGFGIFLISLANLHVFTRIYGKPSNWDNIMGQNYLYSVERASEESVELIAYMMILIAVIELFIFVKRDKILN